MSEKIPIVSRSTSASVSQANNVPRNRANGSPLAKPNSSMKPVLRLPSAIPSARQAEIFFLSSATAAIP